MMKRVLFLFLVALPFFGHSQNHYEINLSKTLNETRLGVWTKGDYKIYIELDVLETYFRKTGKGFLDAVLNNNYEDSEATSYNFTGESYLKTADQLKNSENGFDLKTLIVYYSPEKENSYIIENLVKRLLENGSAAVYYKGERIFKLMKLVETQGESLDFGFNILIYFDDVENYIFKYYEHLGW